MKDSEKRNTVKDRGSIVISRKQKIGAEEKVRIIRKHLRGEIGINEGAREAGVDFESSLLMFQRNLLQLSGYTVFLRYSHGVSSKYETACFVMWIENSQPIFCPHRIHDCCAVKEFPVVHVLDALVYLTGFIELLEQLLVVFNIHDHQTSISVFRNEHGAIGL